MIRRLPSITCLLAVSALVSFGADKASQTATNAPQRHIVAADVYQPKQKIMFHDDFATSGDPIKMWNLSEDDRYGLAAGTEGRISVVDAPHLAGEKAVRFFVNRAPNSFRAEISLPSEKGWNERWYGERILLPEDWVIDPSKARTLVMQWHGIPGNFRATYPNLDIAVQNNHWVITRSFGDPTTKPTRDYGKVDEPIQPGTWVSWVVHAKWAPDESGILEIWKDGKKVFDRKGPNVYGTIGVEYTPYLKTGIYHPLWHVKGDESRKDDASLAAFDAETASGTPVKNKTVYVADFKIGNQDATYEDVAPPIESPAR